jgi:hypothetical protein
MMEGDMQLRNVLFLFLIFSGVSLAQDTNFSIGPQYLVTSSLSMFLQPISTPSLSLGESQPATNEVTPTEIPAISETPMPFIPSSQTFFSDVYWGDHSTSQIEDRRMTTPSLSLSATAENPSVTPTEAEESVPPQSVEAPRVIEISSAITPANLPASITDTGVTGMTDPQSLMERGYGLSLGEFAALLKSHKKSGARVLTNEDLQHH